MTTQGPAGRPGARHQPASAEYDAEPCGAPEFWNRRRVQLPGHDPIELPTTSRTALTGAGFTIIEERARAAARVSTIPSIR